MAVNLFDANFYRVANSDLRRFTDAQAWSHFQNNGLNEGRTFSPFVELNFYRASNPDLANFDNHQLFNHLQNSGVAEGRRFSPFVDISYYRANNYDLAESNNEELFEHLQAYGVREERRFSPFVDLNLYRGANSDLLTRNFDNRQLLEHLVKNGLAEGRRYSLTFDSNYYLRANPDLAPHNQNHRQRLEHFELYGLGEGRTSSENFDVRYYMDSNPDLRAAGFNHQMALQHFDVYGHGEGRQSSPVNSSFAPVYRSYIALINSTQTISAGNTNGLDPISSIPDPGDTPGTAYNIDSLNSGQSFSQNVNYSTDSPDLDDYYRFTLSRRSVFNATLSNLNGDADMQLIRYINSNDVLDVGGGEVIASSARGGTAQERISSPLEAGTYYIRVYPYYTTSGNINYTLTVSASESSGLNQSLGFDLF